MRTNTKFRYKRKYEANPYATSMFLFMKFIVGSDMRNQFLLISCCLTCHRPTKLFPRIEEWSLTITSRPSCAIRLNTSKKCGNRGSVKKFGYNSAFW